MSARAPVRDRPNRSEFWMGEADRSRFPEDIQVRFVRAQLQRRFIRPRNAPDDRAAGDGIAALREYPGKLVAYRCVFRQSNAAACLAALQIQANTPIIEGGERERAHRGPKLAVAR